MDLILCEISCGILCIFNILQFWYWAKLNRELVDKLMSRNYSEYAHSKALEKALPIEQKSADVLNADDPVLRELNGMFNE